MNRNLEELYIENYSNTEFVTEPEVYDYLQKVSLFLQRYNKLAGEIESQKSKTHCNWMIQWKDYAQELIIEVFNSFAHGNFISVSAMTRVLMECYVYIRIFQQAKNQQIFEEWHFAACYVE